MQKLDGVEDLRVRRTCKLLTQALIEGTVEKGFAALTVRDITRRAMVNRSTFYRHYLDKYDLLEQHLNEIYEVLEEGGIIGEGRPEGIIDEEIIGLFKQIQQFPDFYRVMLGPQADAFLSQRFRQQTQQHVLAYFHQTFPGCLHRFWGHGQFQARWTPLNQPRSRPKPEDEFENDAFCQFQLRNALFI